MSNFVPHIAAILAAVFGSVVGSYMTVYLTKNLFYDQKVFERTCMAVEELLVILNDGKDAFKKASFEFSVICHDIKPDSVITPDVRSSLALKSSKIFENCAFVHNKISAYLVKKGYLFTKDVQNKIHNESKTIQKTYMDFLDVYVSNINDFTNEIKGIEAFGELSSESELCAKNISDSIDKIEDLLNGLFHK